jgi:hypothetical protein
MPELLGLLGESTGAHFELLPVENSLFGPTVTTAGLLVSADVRRALADQSSLDVALIPAETLNDGGLFLDDVSFDGLCAELPMPVHPSYDFVDVLSRPRYLGLAAGPVGA